MKLRARLLRLLETIENIGLEALPESHAKHLDGKRWGTAGENSQRNRQGGIYVTRATRRVVILHVFAKKSRKTPLRALEGPEGTASCRTLILEKSTPASMRSSRSSRR